MSERASGAVDRDQSHEAAKLFGSVQATWRALDKLRPFAIEEGRDRMIHETFMNNIDLSTPPAQEAVVLAAGLGLARGEQFRKDLLGGLRKSLELAGQDGIYVEQLASRITQDTKVVVEGADAVGDTIGHNEEDLQAVLAKLDEGQYGAESGVSLVAQMAYSAMVQDSPVIRGELGDHTTDAITRALVLAPER